MTLPRKPEPEEELIPANDPHSLPRKSGVFPVTPEMASSWLSYRNHPKNRPLSPSVSSRYQADMEGGRWREATPEGLIFDTDGWGISFQHRMKALSNVSAETLNRKYGEPFLRFWVFVGEPRDIFDHVDQGFRRTAAHLIRDKYASQTAAGARHLAALADGDRWGMPRYGRITTPETIEAYHQWPELTWYLKDVVACHTEAGVPAPAHLAVMAQAARTEHRELIPAWLAGVRTGFNLGPGDARAHLRNRFRNGYITTGQGNKRDSMYALIVKAWNAYVVGTPLTVLVYKPSVEPMPVVEGFNNLKESAA
jgi:hypothetical protein